MCACVGVSDLHVFCSCFSFMHGMAMGMWVSCVYA